MTDKREQPDWLEQYIMAKMNLLEIRKVDIDCELDTLKTILERIKASKDSGNL